MTRHAIAEEAIKLLHIVADQPNNASAYARLVAKIVRLAVDEVGYLSDERIELLSDALTVVFDAMAVKHAGGPLIRGWARIIRIAEAA